MSICTALRLSGALIALQSSSIATKIHTHTHTHARARAHTHTHTHTHARTHARTHTNWSAVKLKQRSFGGGFDRKSRF